MVRVDVPPGEVVVWVEDGPLLEVEDEPLLPKIDGKGWIGLLTGLPKVLWVAVPTGLKLGPQMEPPIPPD